MDGSLALPGSFSTKSTLMTDTYIGIGPGECAFLTGLEDVIVAAIQDVEGDLKSLQEA